MIGTSQKLTIQAGSTVFCKIFGYFDKLLFVTILPVPNSAMVSDRWISMHCTWLGVEGALWRLRRVQPRRRPARGQEQRRPQPPHNNRSLWQGHLATLTITSTPTSGNPGTDVKFSMIKFTLKFTFSSRHHFWSRRESSISRARMFIRQPLSENWILDGRRVCS